MSQVVGPVFRPHDGLSIFLGLRDKAGLNARHIETAIAPILWSQPSTVLRRKHEVVPVGHGMVLRVVMHHIESTGAEIDEAASGRSFGNRYISETLQRPVNLNTLVCQICP